MKKLMIFLMIAIPLVIIILINFTVDVVIGNVSIAVDRIELDRTEVFANIDEELSLNATIYPSNATNQEIVWKSTNENVAVVDLNGNVSFVGFGNGYITATTVDGNKMASCYFYVTDTVVHEVILTSPKTEVHIGTNVQLSVTVLPNEALNKNVTFVSSDEEIATVDQNGMVTGLKLGRVIISAISEDGGFVGTVSLLITNPVKELVLNSENAVTGENTYRIGYQILPENATNKSVVFEIDDSSIATVDGSGLVTFEKAGEVKVKVTTVDGGFTKTATIVYTAGYAQSLSLEEYSISAKINDSPKYIDYHVIPNSIPNTEVTFVSSNEEVAYVVNGHLYFVGGGNATISVKVEKSEGVYLEQQIMVYVDSPAESIIIDNIVSAENKVQLNPKSFPENSTNTKYFYYSNNPLVTVDANGLVTFNTDSAMTAKIKIYANEDLSNVSTEVEIEYTAGKAKEFGLVDNSLSMYYGQSSVIDYYVFPSNADVSKINVSILSQNNNSGAGDVVQLLPDGSLYGKGGGYAEIEVSLVLLNGEKVIKKLQVEVKRDVEEIEIELDLQQQDGVYVTAESTVYFNGQCLPLDASDKTIVWSVDDKNMAVLLDGKLNFNQVGTIKLTATSASGYKKEFYIQYTGSYPISAEIGIMTENGILEIPKTINVGDTFDVVIKNIFPSNTINKNISLKVSNQSTSSLLGKVLTVDGSSFSAVAGGRATLTVYVSTTIILNFEIEVNQNPQEISVSPANIQTTNSSIELIANVLPIDTTNKQVKFEILNGDIAYIEGNILYFKQNGIAQIVATSLADESIQYSFTIEKIDKGTGNLYPTQDSIEMIVGESLKVDFSSQGIIYDHMEINVVYGEENGIIVLENDVVKALKPGEAEIECFLYDNFGTPIQSYNIEILVKQLVENVLYNGSLEIYNNYITTAKDTTSLKDFKTLPENVSNSTLNFEIVESYNSSGMSENIAYIYNNNICWTKSGTIVLKVSSADGGVSKTFSFKYTGGDALNAELNLQDEITLNVGESVKIEVSRWIPSDAINKQILVKEISHTNGVQVVSLDLENMTITALNGGYSQIIVELSSGITKQIKINVVKLVSSIQVAEDDIVTALNQATINATALPSSALNKTLSFTMAPCDYARLENNKVIFTKAGTVIVTISTMDGSNLTKDVRVTSTMGYLYNIELNTTEKSINKGSSFSLYVKQTYPLDATYKDVSFKILSQQATDGSGKNVISMAENGLVQGLYGGKAIIRAYSFNSNGEEVYTDCVVYVNTPVTKVEIDFIGDVEYYQNLIVTSKNKLYFEQYVYPLDSTNKDFVYSLSDNTKAIVEKGVITFLQTGIVTIRFSAKDTSNGEKFVSYSFYYTGENLLEATLDTSMFEDGTLYLNKGESFNPILTKKIPNDNNEILFSIKNLMEQRNHKDTAVIDFSNGEFYAIGGGVATFDLYANNIFLGTFTINVFAKTEMIMTDYPDVNYVATPSFHIECEVYPYDSSNRNFIYSSSDETIAKVDSSGYVEFYKIGRVVITVKVENQEDIQIQIVVEYTKEIQGISISKNLITEKFVGEYVDFEVIPYPIDAERFTYSVTLMDNSIAEITQLGSTYRIRGLKAGEVEVVVKVDGKNISYSQEFTFYTKLNDIRLELDNKLDANGFGGYRVFGNYFIENNRLIETYKMNYTTSPTDSVNNFADLLMWSSNNEEVATVNENGIVTFVGVGEVTITVSQKPPYENANVVSDSYTFTVVRGINVFNDSQFTFALHNMHTIFTDELKSYIVLHNNILVENEDDDVTLNFNTHGNGYMLDFSNFDNYYKVIVNTNDLVFDNIVFRGVSFENGELSELEDEGVLITIEERKNISFVNCIFENAMTLVETFGSEVEFRGCIFRNSFSSGLTLNRYKDSEKASNVTVEDCIFSRSLLSAIMFNPDNSKVLKGYESKLTIKGDLKIYNWLTMDEFQVGPFVKYFENYGFGSVAESVINKIKNIITTNYPSYKYNYNGKDYYHFGILKIYASASGVANFQSNGIIDKSQMSSKYNYIEGPIKGSVQELGIVLNFNFTMTNLTNLNPCIKPGDTYEGTEIALSEIRQKKNIIYYKEKYAN